MMNNLKKMIAVVIAFTMMSGAFLVMIPESGQSSQVNSEPYADQIPIYAEEDIRNNGIDDMVNPGFELSMEAPMADNIPVDTSNDYITQNMYSGNLYMEQMTKRGEGVHCEVWVADNLNFSSPSDPRNSKVNITDDQVLYIMEEFDTTIYPVMTDTFIEAPALNGTDPDISLWQWLFDDDNLTVEDISDSLYPTNDTGKMMIMIFNIRDDSYYDPDYTGGYIAGFYWSFIRDLYNRNVMHIDCYDWVNRTGEQSDVPGSGHYSYVYESTVAHEYQHLLHTEMDGQEESWINEGLSMMSEYLCGYPLSTSHMAWFMATPDNSLTIWGDQGGINILADYGQVLMFMLYMYDHYGGTEMLQTIFTSQLQGVNSVNEALRDMGYNRMNFDSVFRNWRLANLLWTDEIGAGLYNYKSITWAEVGQELKIMSWDADGGMQSGSDFGQTYTKEGDPTGVYMLDAYGTDYIDLYDIGGMDALYRKLVFDGDDTAIIPEWELYYGMGPLYWYSHTGNELDNLLIMDVDLTAAAAEEGEYLHWLNITTGWDMEDYWDFGFVQVSTDDGLTWTSLNDTGDYCTEEVDSGAMQSIVDNLPGITSWTMEDVELSFDLSAYDGQKIMVGFRYMTDWGTFYDGWYIDQVLVDGAEVPLDDLYPAAGPEVDFMLTVFAPGNENVGPMVMNIPVRDATEVAQRLMGAFMLHDEIIILISPTDGLVDYEFGEIYRGNMMFR